LRPRGKALKTDGQPAPRPSIPVVGPARLRAIRRKLEGRELRSPFKEARDWMCTECRRPTLHWSDSLSLDWTEEGERIFIGNLTGLLCDGCGARSFDVPASRVISRVIESRRPRHGYLGSISALGRGKLGIYLPKDVVHNVDARRGAEVRITPMTRRKLLVEIL